MMKKGIVLWLTVSILLGMLTACEDGVGGFLSSGQEETERPFTWSYDISFPIAKVRTLNPVASLDEDSYYIGKLIYQGLYELNENLMPVPILAEGARLDEDGVTMTVSLRSGVLWSDGSSFTADDVKFSIDAYLFALGKGMSLYDPYTAAIKSAKKEDDHTIRIVFRDSASAALENLTFPILPSHQFRRVSSVADSGSDFVPIGTGPYMVDSLDPSSRIVLSANPHYNGGKPENRLIFKVLPDKKTAVNLFDIGDIDFTVLKEGDRDTLINDKKLQNTSFYSNEVEFLGFHKDREVLKNKRVRQAIATAIDLTSIVDECYYGNGVISDTLYYPNYLGVSNTEDPYPFDLEKAETLLTSSGFSDLDEDGRVEDELGQAVTLRLLVNGEDVSRNLAAQMVASNLNKLGIAVTVESLTWEAYVSALEKGDYDLYIGGYQVRDAYGVNSILRTGGGNPYDLSLERLDPLIAGLNRTTGQEEKAAAFEAVRETLIDELPYYTFLYKTYGAVAAEGLEGQIQSRYFDLYNGCENFRVKRYQKAADPQV